MRILLIEDDPIMNFQMTDLLQGFGKVTSISRYEDALATISECFFEVPILSKLEFIERVRIIFFS